MREVPSDIEEPQAEFDDAVCRIFEDPDWGYEVLERNMSNDPFEPDLIVMDRDEWVFNVVCYYIEEIPDDGILELYPKTFGMRKWVEDSEDRPAFIALGAGGTPRNPDLLYFMRFFDADRQMFDIKAHRMHQISWLRPEFFDAVITREFERIFGA